MIYYIYKKRDAKKRIESDISRIYRYIYDDNDLEKLQDKIRVINYSSIKNQELLYKLEETKYMVSDKDNNLYYKLYNKEMMDNQSEYLIDIIRMITFFHSGDENTNYFHLFFDLLNIKIYNELSNNKMKSDILDEISDLGLVAFANNSNIKKDNDLINSFLYDRDLIKSIYDETMGEGAFDLINQNSFMLIVDYALNNKNVSDNEYRTVVDNLRDYFYRKISLANNISQEEKDTLIKKFENTYNDLESKKVKYKKKIL